MRVGKGAFVWLVIVASLAIGMQVGASAGHEEGEPRATLRYQLRETLVPAPYRLVVRKWLAGRDNCTELRRLSYDIGRSRVIYRCVTR